MTACCAAVADDPLIAASSCRRVLRYGLSPAHHIDLHPFRKVMDPTCRHRSRTPQPTTVVVPCFGVSADVGGNLIIATARTRPPKSGLVICCCRLAYPWWLRPMRPALRRCFLPRLLRHLHLSRRRPRVPAAFLLDCPVAIPTAMGEATDRIRSPQTLPRPRPAVLRHRRHGEQGVRPLHPTDAFGHPMSRSLAFGAFRLP